MAISAEQKKALEAAGYSVKGQTVMTKDGKSIGGYNENGKIWSGSGKVRDILKSKPEPKAEAKPAAKSRPAKAESKSTSQRPKSNPARQPGGARPEGKAAGMPAAKKDSKTALAAGLPVVGAAARVAAGRKPAQGRPYNPNYTGRSAMPEGPQGRYATGVGRPVVTGAGRAIGGNPARRLRGGGGGVLKMPDILDLKNMAKGGLVSKKK